MMPQIHPTAYVDPRAELADDVVVGPQCHIDGEVHIGAGTRLIGHAYLQGPLTLGRGNTVYPFSCLGFAPQDRTFDPGHAGAGTVIGDENVIREGVTIHRATGDTATTVGGENYLMAGCHLGHDARVGSRCTFANGVLLAGHVRVADAVVFGGHAAVQQFCRVGRLAMIGGTTALTQDIPPFCTVRRDRAVAGLNLVGLRRAGLRGHIPLLKRAFDILYRQGLSNATAADRIEAEAADDPLCRELAEFIRTTDRGLTGSERG